MAASSSSRSDEYTVVEETQDGRYVRYEKIIGQGDLKKIYMGFDNVDSIEIAWCQTQLPEDSYEDVLKFMSKRADRLELLDHENIQKCYKYWVDESTGIFNMITEVFTSGNLREYTDKHAVDRTAIKNWCRQILDALNYLHTVSELKMHGDVKIENIFIDGNLGMVKLGYSGYLRTAKQGVQLKLKEGRTLAIAVTPETLSPDSFTTDYDGKADIFSFGMTVVQIVTKEKLYSECNDNTLVCEMIKKGELPAALNNVKDLEIREFIDQCLRPKSDRPAAIDLLRNNKFLADTKRATANTEWTTANIQTLKNSVRNQVARLLQAASPRTEPEEEETNENVSPSRPPPDPETKVPETTTAASQSTELKEEEEEEEDETPLLHRRSTTRNVKHGDETFSSQGGSSKIDKQDQTFKSPGESSEIHEQDQTFGTPEGSIETVSSSKTHETSTDEKDQTSGWPEGSSETVSPSKTHETCTDEPDQTPR